MMKTTANKITMFRIALIPVFLILAYTGHLYVALAVYIIACLSDVADGYIARHYNQVSDFGKFMDPLADKMLVMAAMFREFAVSGLRLIAVEQGRVIAAAWSGKLKTGCTMVGLSAMMLFSEAAAVNTIFTVLILITTVGSGIHYFWVNRDVFKS